MRPVNSHDSLSRVIYASVFIVSLDSFELKPKPVARYTIGHQKCVAVTDCPLCSSFLKLYFLFYFKMYYPQEGLFFFRW